MKKLLCLLLAVLMGLGSLSLSAQESSTLTVADGTTTNYNVPIYGTYADALLKAQIIYPASMLSDMEGGEISSFKFYMSSMPESPWGSVFVVKLGTTGSSAFSSASFVTGANTTVYTGLLNPDGNGIVTVNCSNNFVYPGGNLLVEVYSQSTDGNWSSGTFLGEYSVGGSVSGYSYDAVSSISNAQVHDFIPKTTFTYSGGTSCYSPNDLAVTNITINSAVFSWHPRSTGTCYYHVDTAGADLSVATWTAATDTFCTLSNLIPGTFYIAYVRTDCGDEMSGTQSTSFYTLCDAVNSFPYFEGFEDEWINIAQFGQTNQAPQCWSVYNGGGTVDNYGYTNDYRWKPNISNNQVYEGNHSAVCYTDYASYPHNDWLVSPLINLTDNLQLSFWAQRAYNNSSEPEEISIWISNENLIPTAPPVDTTGLDTIPLPGFTQIFQTDIPYGPFRLYEIPLTGYTGNRYIAFVRRNYPNDGYYLCLDNVAVEEIPACMRPDDLNADSVGTDFANLTWNSDASEYILYYKLAEADSFSVITEVTLNGDSIYELNGLLPGHDYLWYVAAVCEDGTVLPTSYVMEFMTNCVPITSLPYTCDFETNNIGANGDLPACWSKPGYYTYPYIYSYASYSHSGSHSMYIYSTSPVYAILPELGEDISIGGLQLSLWAMSYYATECVIEVGAMTSPTATASFTVIDSITDILGDYSEFQVDLSSYEGTDNYLALRITCGSYTSYGYTYSDNIYIDDVTLMLLPTCPRPENVTVSNTTPNSATLTWASEENGFMVYYKQANATAFEAATEEAVTDTTFTVQNLVPGKQYIFYVSSVCSDGSETPSITISAILPCEGISTLPYFCDFESNLVGDDYPLPECWTRGSSNSMYPYVYNYNTYQGNGALYTYSPNTVSMRPLDTTEISFEDIQVSFYAKAPYGSTSLKVGVMSDPANPSTFVQVGNDIVLTSAYTYYDIPLSSYQGNGTMVAFRTTDYYDVYIDNVTLEELPDCMRPTILGVSSTSTQATVTWSADGEADAWQVVITNSYADPNTLSPEDVSENSYTFEELTPGTTYQVYVRTDCGSQYSDWSNVYSFITLLTDPAIVPYTCDFENLEENGNWIMVNGYVNNKWFIDTAANNTPDGIYGLYVSADSGATNTYNFDGSNVSWAYRDLMFGNASEFNLTFDWHCLGEGSGDYNSDYLSVWISTPVNVSAGSYPSTPESLVELGEYYGSAEWNSASITLDGSLCANSVKRLYFRWDNDYSYGQNPAAAVDNISITEVSCARPANVSISTIGTTTATLNITPASDGDSEWEISLNDSIFTVSTDEVELQNLIPASQYEVMVRTICGGGDTSVWTLPVSFLTECLLVNSVPQTWDFESNLVGDEYAQLPVCWNRINSPESYYSEYPYVTDYGQTHSGWNSLEFYNYYEGSYGILPPIDPDVLNIQELQVSFYAGQDVNSSNVSLVVGVMTDPTDASTFTPVQSFTIPDAMPTDPFVASFANYTGNGTYIAFMNDVSGYAYSDLYLDDVTLEEIPSCLPPSSVTVSAIMENSAEVSWTENNDATAWTIRYHEVGDDENVTEVSVNSNPFTITGLTPGTFYIVQVQTSCSANESSNWATSPSFMTNCTAISAFPYTEGFENGELGCWSNETLTGNNPWNFYSYNAHSGTYSIHMNYTPGTSSRLTSPVFDFSNYSNPTLSFYYNQAPYSSVVDTFSVYYKTSPTSEWVWLAGYTQATSGYETDTLVLPNPSATYQIAFVGYGCDGNSIDIDDITIAADTGSAPVLTDPTVATTAATAVTQTTATLNGTITNPDNVTITAKGFEWKASSAADFTVVNVTGDALTHPLTGLTANTGYTFKAFITFNGTTAYGEEMTFTTLPEDAPEPCDVPTNLHTTAIENHAINIAWDANANVSSWNIQYRTQNGQWSNATSNTNSYNIAGLEGLTTYEIQVQANCGDGNLSDWSGSITATTTNVGIEEHLLNSITLYPNPANDVVNVQCTMYNVQGVEVFDVFGKLINTVIVTENPTRINVSGLANGMYFVRVTTDEGAVTKTFVKK